MNIEKQRKNKKRQLEFHMATPCLFNHWVKERKPRSVDRSKIVRRAWIFPIVLDGEKVDIFHDDLNKLSLSHGGNVAEKWHVLQQRKAGVDMTKSAKKKFLRKYADIMIAQR